MRKIAPAAFLVAGILVFGGLFVASPAHAEDENEQTSNTEVSPTPVQTHNPKVHSPKRPKGPRVIKQHIKRRELEQKYGKEGHLSLPPLVIRPKRDTDDVAEGSSLRVGDDDDAGNIGNPTSGTASAGKGAASTGNSSGATTSEDSSGSVQTAGTASAGFIAVNPAAKNSVVTVKTGTMVNPKQNTAIDLTNVKITKKTPADMFIQAAQVGLYAMAAGALALSVVAASRAIRRK